MEIYYTTKLEGRTGSASAWSKATGYPALLAVALGPSSVGIFTEEGRPLEPSKPGLISNVRSTECLKLAWHPLLPLLAIGWKDGAISFWNYEDRHLEEDSKTHRTSVASLTWSQAGDRLISADENGKVSIWKTDRLLRPIHVVSYEEQPGCKVRLVCLGPVAVMPETGTMACNVYYAVSNQGKTVIKWANDQGYQGVVQELPEELTSLLHYQERGELLAVGASCSLYHLGKPSETGEGMAGTWKVISKMKFATGSSEAAKALQICWAAPHTLASAAEKDTVVRLYNFETEDNYVLQVYNQEEQQQQKDIGTASTASTVACLASDSRYGLLAAGTADGRITVFRYMAPSPGAEPVADHTKCWEAQPAFPVGAQQSSIEWGITSRIICVMGQGVVNVCRKKLLQQFIRDDVAVIQAGVDRVLLENVASAGKQPPKKLQLPLQVLGLDFSRGTLLAWDGANAQVHKMTDGGTLTLAGTFECTSRAMAINNDSIYKAVDGRIEVCNVSGTIKQTLVFEDAVGNGPCLLDCNRDYLAAVTPNHTLRVFKVAGREAKPHQGPAMMLPAETCGNGLVIDILRVNSSGNMVAALCSSEGRSRIPRLFVYCFENQATLAYDFNTDHKIPQTVSWDIVESKVLAVQTMDDGSIEETAGSNPKGNEVAVCFVSPEHGVLLQEYESLDAAEATSFIGIQAPYLILNKPTTTQPTSGAGSSFTTHATSVLMHSFAGLQDGDTTTKTALLDFSYHLATGNMDEAFRAVKTIKSSAVWESMAHTCIKNKRLDVAEHCLGNMGHARGARAVREAQDIEELDARIATVAIHLGMLEDAKKLYASADRYDLLSKLYQACGQWEKAIEVAEKNDRIHLTAVHYAYAQHLEKTDQLAAARKYYEAAGCGGVEVPRMLYQCNKMDELEQYINNQPDDRTLMIWWARYCESRGDIKRAVQCYEKASDALSVVRIQCATQDFTAAEEQVMRLGDPAAAFHLARQYEALGKTSDAIRFYTQAQRYSHGVRLAKAHGLDSELVNLALKSTPNVMVDAADYLNDKGEHERAALLYMKGGKLSKAVDMCFAAQLFEVLQHIADDLSNSGADPGLYSRCAEFFMQHGHYDKAVKMLIAADKYSRALEMCLEQDVTITEEMADAMTPSKEAMSTEERVLMLNRIAKLAKRQGSWQLAAKKFTQAGDKVKAMKCLLRSGDTDKIIFFAGVSRQKEVYLMAAHYLQALAWHSNPELMKNIINFYTKAQAVERLSAFYEACAQIEIDEYREYEKALQAMREAYKQMSKSKLEDRDMQLSLIQQRILNMEKFVSARNMISSQPQQAFNLCGELLMSVPAEGADAESGIRLGDVYAMMIEYYYQARNAVEAYKLIEQMRGRGINIKPYVEQRMVDDIYQTLGVQPIIQHQGEYAQVDVQHYSSTNGVGDEDEIGDEEGLDRSF